VAASEAEGFCGLHDLDSLGWFQSARYSGWFVRLFARLEVQWPCKTFVPPNSEWSKEKLQIASPGVCKILHTNTPGTPATDGIPK